jgi:NhaA family Na+:H+ antiporter
MRPPPNLSALMAQAQAVIDAEMRFAGDDALRSGPSEPTLRALDVVHDRMESPASKLLHAAEPWSSYLVLPIFALANAGVVWSSDVLFGHAQLVIAIVLGLVAGKLAGIFLGARLAVGLGIGEKPATYSWRQLAGAGALGGIGFTMSLFIAGQAFTGVDFDAAKIAIFIASLLAGLIGMAILWKRVSPGTASEEASEEAGDPGTNDRNRGTPVGQYDQEAA